MLKKYMFIFLMIIVFCTSCTINNKPPKNNSVKNVSSTKVMPEIVTIEDKEYKLANEFNVFPVSQLLRSNIINIEKTTYYKYPVTSFDCYITYDISGLPCIYFDIEKYDEAMSYYNNSSNYNFFCLLGNVYEDEPKQLLKLEKDYPEMLDKLIKFSKEKEYKLFGVNNDELKEIPILDLNSFTKNEIHLYKRSIDEAFTTSKGYKYIEFENKLYLLYSYDFKKNCMNLIYIPTEISDYFVNFLDKIK